MLPTTDTNLITHQVKHLPILQPLDDYFQAIHYQVIHRVRGTQKISGTGECEHILQLLTAEQWPGHPSKYIALS